MSIRAKLGRLHSPDLPDLERGVPEDPTCFGILVQALISPHDEHGEESFDFLVCTPLWLANQMREGEYRLGLHYLFLMTYDYSVLWQAITHVCGMAQGNDWATVAARLAWYGRWEFEDDRDDE